MYPKRILSGALAAASLIAAGALLAADRPHPQVHLGGEIVVKVNGQIITRGELEQGRQLLAEELREQKALSGDALEAEVNKETADSLRDHIDQLLLVQKAKELNINVDGDVNKRIAEIQSESKISDPEKFHEWLQEQLHGVSFEDFKEQTKNRFLTDRVISQEVYQSINIPMADIEKFYNEHKTEF